MYERHNRTERGHSISIPLHYPTPTPSPLQGGFQHVSGAPYSERMTAVGFSSVHMSTSVPPPPVRPERVDFSVPPPNYTGRTPEHVDFSVPPPNYTGRTPQHVDFSVPPPNYTGRFVFTPPFDILTPKAREGEVDNRDNNIKNAHRDDTEKYSCKKDRHYSSYSHKDTKELRYQRDVYNNNNNDKSDVREYTKDLRKSYSTRSSSNRLKDSNPSRRNGAHDEENHYRTKSCQRGGIKHSRDESLKNYRTSQSVTHDKESHYRTKSCQRGGIKRSRDESLKNYRTSQSVTHDKESHYRTKSCQRGGIKRSRDESLKNYRTSQSVTHDKESHYRTKSCQRGGIKRSRDESLKNYRTSQSATHDKESHYRTKSCQRGGIKRSRDESLKNYRTSQSVTHDKESHYRTKSCQRGGRKRSRDESLKNYRTSQSVTHDKESHYRTKSCQRGGIKRSRDESLENYRSSPSVPRDIGSNYSRRHVAGNSTSEIKSTTNKEQLDENEENASVTDPNVDSELGSPNRIGETSDARDHSDTCDGEETGKRWYRSSPASFYYVAVEGRTNVVRSTDKGKKLLETFKDKLVERGKKARPSPGTENYPPPRPRKPKVWENNNHETDGGNGRSDSESDYDREDNGMEELQRKIKHPRRLHPDLWYNDPGELNDGPVCRCSARNRRQGVNHGVFVGEPLVAKCESDTNNIDKLWHYRITISPTSNLLKNQTVIIHDRHEFLFVGFSMLCHYQLKELPPCVTVKYNIEYTVSVEEEQPPYNFTIEELNVLEEFLFQEILELVDVDVGKHNGDGCSQFHLLPRWEREIPGGEGEVLSICEVLKYLLKAGDELVPASSLNKLLKVSDRKWQAFVDGVRGSIVTYPGKKPCSLRVDQLDRVLSDEEVNKLEKSHKSHSFKGKSEKKHSLFFPQIVHFGLKPPQVCYIGNSKYKKMAREYKRLCYLVSNRPNPSNDDKIKASHMEALLKQFQRQPNSRRNVIVTLSSQGFYRTGIMCDVVQHSMFVPYLMKHLRFHKSLESLEETIEYKFKNRSLLQLALTHPSYTASGGNGDHMRNLKTNCGMRHKVWGDSHTQDASKRKKGLLTLLNIMSQFGTESETESSVKHNERLEFLGDAVVEFITTLRLFRMFPELGEGGLSALRTAIVQNLYLGVLAKKIDLDKYILYSHGSDLCLQIDFSHALANCFEALMGALLLDSDMKIADGVFALALWKDDPNMYRCWMKKRAHTLQEEEPLGDRKWIPQYPCLQKLTEFEDAIGVRYKHIRLLARAFADHSLGYSYLTMGSNQRFEFLGDSLVQLICTDYLYRHFPQHHEGHLSLLRATLVNNRTQATVCDDLAMTNYVENSISKLKLSVKDKADILEAFLGSLYIDQGFKPCVTFCEVCLFPQLSKFIIDQDWLNPKSKLQQLSLALRTSECKEPPIPVYKVIEHSGPTNIRQFTVAVYFQGKRLATGEGPSIQCAEEAAAEAAVINTEMLSSQLDYHKRVLNAKLKTIHTKVNGDDIHEMPGCGKSFAKNRRKVDNLPRAYRSRDEKLNNSEDDSNTDTQEKSKSKNKREKSSQEIFSSGEGSSAFD